MKLRPFNESDFSFFLSLKCGPEAKPFDMSRPFELWMLCTNDDEPIGFMSVFDIIPGEKGEFGIYVTDPRGKNFGKLMVKFIKAVFDGYRLRLIYCNISSESGGIGAKKLGFVDNVLTYERFINKWSGKEVDDNGSRSDYCGGRSGIFDL